MIRNYCINLKKDGSVVEPNKTFVDVNIAPNAVSSLLAVIDHDVIFLPAMGHAFNITFQILTGQDI